MLYTQYFSICLFVISNFANCTTRNRRKQKFVRLPSGLTFPADAARNFQRDTYVPATFSPPSEKILQAPPRYSPTPDSEGSRVSGQGGSSHVSGMNYIEYKNALQQKSASPESSAIAIIPTEGQKAVDSYPASPPPESSFAMVEGAGGEANMPAPTVVASPGVTPAPEVPALVTEAPLVVATTATVGLKKENIESFVSSHHHTMLTPEQQSIQKGHTYTALGGGQFYQSLLGGKGSFSPLSFLLNGLGGGGSNPGYLVPVPVVIPPPPPPPPGPKCFTNPSGFLCCNVTLEKTMEDAYNAAKAEGISSCNVQKMATAVQEQSEKKFGTTFESIAAHKDFVAKINFAGDLNCKIEIDGKFILAYATPLGEQEVNIVDANSFFSGTADADLEGVNGTKPTYIVYGPIKK